MFADPVGDGGLSFFACPLDCLLDGCALAFHIATHVEWHLLVIQIELQQLVHVEGFGELLEFFFLELVEVRDIV